MHLKAIRLVKAASNAVGEVGWSCIPHDGIRKIGRIGPIICYKLQGLIHHVLIVSLFDATSWKGFDGHADKLQLLLFVGQMHVNG